MVAVECRVRDVAVHYAEHGEGRPVLVLHGAGVDHREAEACFEPALRAYGGLRRLFPDLSGMGRTPAPSTLQSADDVPGVLTGFADPRATLAVLDGAGHALPHEQPSALAALVEQWLARVP
jgi:pimeloyl-ACP methyl ester carboxylesterase